MAQCWHPGPDPFRLHNVPPDAEHLLDPEAHSLDRAFYALWFHPITSPWIAAVLPELPPLGPDAQAFLAQVPRLSSLAKVALAKAITRERRDRTCSIGEYPFADPLKGPQAFAELQQTGFLVTAPAEQRLASLAVDDLRQLLRDHDIAAKGRKADLVRIAANAIRQGTIALAATEAGPDLAVLPLSPAQEAELAEAVRWRRSLLELYLHGEYAAQALRRSVADSYELGTQRLEIIGGPGPCGLCEPLMDTVAPSSSLCWGDSRGEQLLPVHPGCTCTVAPYMERVSQREPSTSPQAIRAAWEGKMRLAGISTSAPPPTAATSTPPPAPTTATPSAYTYAPSAGPHTRTPPKAPDWLPVAMGSAGALGLTLLIVAPWGWKLIGFAIMAVGAGAGAYFYLPR